jgi:hypothetical protein
MNRLDSHAEEEEKGGDELDEFDLSKGMSTSLKGWRNGKEAARRKADGKAVCLNLAMNAH